eukprot:4652735-Prymnesium_polylepis.1
MPAACSSRRRGAAVPPSRDSMLSAAGGPGGGGRALSGIQGLHSTGCPVSSSTRLAMTCTTVKGSGG